jgi:hypothetical protein
MTRSVGAPSSRAAAAGVSPGSPPDGSPGPGGMSRPPGAGAAAWASLDAAEALVAALWTVPAGTVPGAGADRETSNGAALRRLAFALVAAAGLLLLVWLIVGSPTGDPGPAPGGR